MFLGIRIDQSISNRFDFPPLLVEDATEMGLECFQGGDAVMPGLISDEVVSDTLIVNMTSSTVDLNGQGMSGKTMMEDV